MILEPSDILNKTESLYVAEGIAKNVESKGHYGIVDEKTDSPIMIPSGSIISYIIVETDLVSSAMATSLIVGGSDTFGGAASERYYNNLEAFPSFPSSKNLVPISIFSGTTKNYLSISIESSPFSSAGVVRVKVYFLL